MSPQLLCPWFQNRLLPPPTLSLGTNVSGGDQANGGGFAQWSGVAGNGWKTTAIGNNIRTKEELFEFQEQWEADADERSELFRLATMLVAQDDWEADAQRTDLFKFAKFIVEQEDWEDSQERSTLFDVCWNLTEQEDWEDSPERSALFDVCWNLVEQEDWEDSPERSTLFDVCWNLAEQEDWEDSPERSALFDVCWNLVEQGDWEADAQRSDLFKFAKFIVEQEDWEDSPERSTLFDVCWNLAEQEDWEDSPERSALFDVCWYISEQEEWEQDISRSQLFKMAAAQLESISDDDSSEESDSSDLDTLVLPPHWSRNQFNTLRAGVVPLATVVVEETNYQKGAVSNALEMPGSPPQPKGELQGSPCNVAAMWDAFALPALELAHS